jgi:hypothetical protein
MQGAIPGQQAGEVLTATSEAAIHTRRPTKADLQPNIPLRLPPGGCQHPSKSSSLRSPVRSPLRRHAVTLSLSLSHSVGDSAYRSTIRDRWPVGPLRHERRHQPVRDSRRTANCESGRFDSHSLTPGTRGITFCTLHLTTASAALVLPFVVQHGHRSATATPLIPIELGGKLQQPLHTTLPHTKRRTLEFPRPHQKPFTHHIQPFRSSTA